MLTANTDALEKSLAEYKTEVERKLKHMVAGFAREIAETASGETAIGDENRLFGLYQARYRARRIAPNSGFHKGAWVYTEGELTFKPTIYDVTTMVDKAEYTAQANYKIGDTFYIGAEGTAYEFLERRDGILEDAMRVIQGAHQSNLQRYYEEG